MKNTLALIDSHELAITSEMKSEIKLKVQKCLYCLITIEDVRQILPEITHSDYRVEIENGGNFSDVVETLIFDRWSEKLRGES